MLVRGNVNVRGADEFDHLFRTDKTVVEDDLRFYSYFLRQGMQAGSVLVPLATEDVRMSGACDDVGNVLVFGQNLRQGLDNVFDSFIR